MMSWSRAALVAGLAALAETALGQGQPQAVRDPAALGVSIGAGARALGMGGAFIAVADDGTASSWNPAGLAVLEKPEVSVVWKARDHQRIDHAPFVFEAASADEVFRQNDDSFVEALSTRAFDFASASYPWRIGSVKLVPQGSYQRAVDQGHRSETLKRAVSFIHTESSGDFALGSDTTIEEAPAGRSRGGIDVWSLSLGVGPHPRVFAGVALNWWRKGAVAEAAFTSDDTTCFYSPDDPFHQSCATTRGQGNLSTQTSFRGFNVNVGLLARVHSMLRVGAVYKTGFRMRFEQLDTHGVTLDVEGGTFDPDAESEEEIFVPFGERVRVAGQNRTVGDLHWPRTIGVGLAFTPRADLTVAADFTTTAWSRAVYDFAYQTSEFFHATGTAVVPILSEDSGTEKLLWPTQLEEEDEDDEEGAAGPEEGRRQRDTYQARLGVEYVLTRRKLVVPLRAGGFLDRQYFTDGEGRGVRAWGWTVGAGMVWSSLAVDVAYVRQSLGYSLSFVSEVGGPGSLDREEQRALRDDRLSSDRLYVSAIVRF